MGHREMLQDVLPLRLLAPSASHAGAPPRLPWLGCHPLHASMPSIRLAVAQHNQHSQSQSAKSEPE